MPSFLHGKNSRVVFADPVANASYDLSQFFNDVSVGFQVDTPETTTFLNGGVRTYINGLKQGTISMSGFFDGSAGAVDSIINTAIANATDEAIIVFPDGGTSANSACQMARGLEAKYDTKTPVNGVVAVDMELQADAGVWRGKGQTFTATSSSNTTALDNRGQTTAGGLLIINVLSLTGTLTYARLEHSTDNVTYTAVANTTITSAGVLINTTLSNPLYRYTRLAYSLSGVSPSVTISYGLARY